MLLAAILFYNYNPAREDFFPTCPFLYLTGLLCPGCGSQRALHQLLHGNITAALRLNMLLVISVPFLLYHQLYLLNLHYNFIGINVKNIMYSPKFTYAVLAIVFLYWILRNISLFPFNMLAPH